MLLRQPLHLGLGLSSLFAAYTVHATTTRPRALLLDSPASSTPPSGAFRSYATDAKVPVWKDGRINPGAYRQISAGSICGLLCGVAVSTFSKSLAFLIGLFVFGAQFLASKGIHVIPTTRIQRYIKGVDLRSALEDNVAFKFTFGTTFMLAAFAEFQT